MSQLVLATSGSSPVTHSWEHLSAAPTMASRQPSRALLTAWLLLLFERQPAHGYELRRQLEAHGVSTEPAAMYRVLRKLEGDGCATSSWAKSVSGPRRRQYELTTQGRRELDELVATLTATHDAHAAFLQAHQRALRESR
ncbi:MAG: hypothetical protein AVDCRST_MAG67-1463 [uncultured Solirubrobacteraceae bacterium]|uniref:Transcription regulator PadR N-terminal domain-containing protein n=1 Tax=uncultured Solirubrobacteraceae bacterium TaxID=1162706 RepID=A0A6J4S944_9ACTN|nr:MAG: hypothetical protein AVDCRST_MAG67-1463 [uncultured Solirubrobacteraceae bacterium]